MPGHALLSQLDKFPASQVGLAYFCRRWKIAELALFGSALRDELTAGSDIDLLVTFAPDAEWSLFDHARMGREPEGLMQREVDLVSRRAIERSTNWIRRKSILESAQVILWRNQGAV